VRQRNAAPRAAAAAAGALLALLAACQTTRPDQVVTSAGEEEIGALDTFGARLLELRLAPDPAALTRLRGDLDRAAAAPGSSRSTRARVDALRAEAAFAAGDASAARRLVDAAAALSEAEEGVWIVRAALEPDPAKRLAVLERGLAAADTRARLTAERGESLLAAGRYAEAAQDLDEGLRGLDPSYARLYGQDRDRALTLARAARDSGTASVGTAAPARGAELGAPLTTRAMVESTLQESHLLASLSPDASPGFVSLLPALKTAGLLLDPAAPPDGIVSRKAAAWYLWEIVARAEHNPKLLTLYRQKYATSPVPDVAVNEQWFDAVLGTVEREIMDLPDGVHFRPDDAVTGLDFVTMLARMKKLYP
jgi:tetratricopeptide (TPR) repeat protein